MADYGSGPDEKPDPEPKPVSKSDDEVLKELRERFDYASVQWAPNVERGNLCLAYADGDTWNIDDAAVRQGRPKLKLDQLSQYSNQLVNSFRQNPRGAKVSPAGSGATDKTAELRANRIRQIEHDSHAQEVYTVAGENAVTRGYGYARIVAEYEDAESDNQTLKLKAIPNPNQVLPDPDAESTSGADWQYLFFIHTLTKREFRRDYPDAQIKDFDADTIALAPRWFGKDGRVQVAEYWYVTETPNPRKKGRPTRKVCMYLTNGVELLSKPGYPKKTEWPGASIPFAACYGKITYSTNAGGDALKMCDSYIWLALDAAKSYNWTKSTELEALALPVKAALFAYEGQLDQTQVDLLEKSTREPVALITAKAITNETGSQILPLPQYGTRGADIQGYEIAAESFRRDVQNALGRYSAADHRIGSTKVTSGVALAELTKTGDLGSYHFAAHYDDFVREIAVKLNELLPFYDDAPKEVSTRLPDGTTKMVKINTPTARADNGQPAYGPEDLRMDQGRHTVTISTGPSSDSQREAGKEAAMALLGNPVAFPVIAADATRLMDLGPIGDQMAEDLEFLQPPVMQQARQQRQQGGGPDPRQLMQENAQLKQQVQHAEQVMTEQDGQLKGKQAEIASQEQQTQLKIQSAERIAQQASQDKAADREVKLAVAEIGAKVKETQLFIEERARVGVQDEAAKTRAHEVQMELLKHEHQARLVGVNADATLKTATQKARIPKTVKFTKGADGGVQSATISIEGNGTP